MTVEELQAYMGFMILMGIVHLPSIYDYWKKDEVYHYSPVASRISRDHFFELHRYLHFADNSSLGLPGTPEYDKLGKIKPIIEKLSERFRSVYTPQMNVAIDEAMIPFKGRSTSKQYMPLKPVRRGIKMWALADSLNGFVSEFEVYTGKKTNAVEKNLGANVVKILHSITRTHSDMSTLIIPLLGLVCCWIFSSLVCMGVGHFGATERASP